MLRMIKCSRCGKQFIKYPQHLYKLIKNNKKLYYCSYTCWRACGGDSGIKRNGVQRYW